MISGIFLVISSVKFYFFLIFISCLFNFLILKIIFFLILLYFLLYLFVSLYIYLNNLINITYSSKCPINVFVFYWWVIFCGTEIRKILFICFSFVFLNDTWYYVVLFINVIFLTNICFYFYEYIIEIRSVFFFKKLLWIMNNMYFF